MDFQDLTAQLRSTTGKGPARSLRREGLMPAVLYGPDTEPLNLTVNVKELENTLKQSLGGQVLLNLQIGDAKDKPRAAMLKEVQSDPLSGALLHADFYEVAMDRKIRVKVPITTVGKSKGVEFGGMMQIIRRELEILCLPSEIPDVIELDITDLDIGGSIHVADIPVTGNIEIPFDANFTIITILSPKLEAVEEEEEEGEEGEVGEEVEGAEEGTDQE